LARTDLRAQSLRLNGLAELLARYGFDLKAAKRIAASFLQSDKSKPQLGRELVMV
jgi:hypothetical protein